MGTRLYWVDGPWPGKLALSARPRGGDWLEDDLANWRREGVDAVVSLLTSDEEADLELGNEAGSVTKQNMDFMSIPIRDRQVPTSQTTLTNAREKINADLSSGKNVLIHCRQGIGRTGTVAACLLVSKGWTSSAAVDYLSSLRGIPVPETPEQRQWIDQYAAIMAGTK